MKSYNTMSLDSAPFSSFILINDVSQGIAHHISCLKNDWSVSEVDSCVYSIFLFKVHAPQWSFKLYQKARMLE